MFALRIRHAVVATAAFVTMAACGGDSATGPASVSGTYTLQSLNGKVLPATVIDSIPGLPPVSVTVLSPSSLALNANMTFIFSLTLRVSQAGSPTTTTTETANGSYTKTGNSLSLTANGETISATWDGNNTITLNEDGDIMVFKR